MSDELYKLLQTAKIDGSIVLAGHSLGGIVSLIYSAEHEEQVEGNAGRGDFGLSISLRPETAVIRLQTNLS